jgi:Ala-tRNA(Pro) deacylase
MPAEMVKEFLDHNQVKYISIAHSTAYTAQEIAALTHTPGKELAKTVIVEIDAALVMAVLPSSQQIDLVLLKDVAGGNAIRLVSETEFEGCFPDCATGAMPPFGNLYGMAVFADESLARDKEIAFNAGSHNELIRLAYEDFETLVRPTIARFSRPLNARLAA